MALNEEQSLRMFGTKLFAIEEIRRALAQSDEGEERRRAPPRSKSYSARPWIECLPERHRPLATAAVDAASRFASAQRGRGRNCALEDVAAFISAWAEKHGSAYARDDSTSAE